MNPETILKVIDYKKHFHINKHVYVKAVDGVSFEVRKGEIFALVGESGCGKSTMAKAVMGLFPASAGQVYFKGRLLSDRGTYRKCRKHVQRDLQVIFQDSAAALNPRMLVFDLIAEPLTVNKMYADKRELKRRIEELMHTVGLDPMYQSKYPGDLSGGQRQRTAIARAISLEPELIVADEPVASLDVSVQAQIVSLFQKLQKEKGFSFLFIAHDLSLVRFISDRVGVMYAGKLVEKASTASLFAEPSHAYTRSLLSAIPVPDPVYERSKKLIDFDHSTFKAEGTTMIEIAPGHFVRS